MGLVPHPHPNMDISSQRHHWSYSLPNPRGRGLLLCHPDLQYISTLPSPQQTDIPSGSPLGTEAAQ